MEGGQRITSGAIGILKAWEAGYSRGRHGSGRPSNDAVDDDQDTGQTDKQRNVDDPIVFGISLFFIGVVHPIQHGMGIAGGRGVHLLKKADLFFTEMVYGFAKSTHAVSLNRRLKEIFL
jgi:hypothetical protein